MALDFTTAYLRSVQLLKEQVPSFDAYPFHLPAVSALEQLELHPRVTYIVGENGMGKSTMLEAIAVAMGFNAEGGTVNFSFATRETHSELHQYLRTVRGARRPKDGFFFRAESYYNVASEVDALEASHNYGGTSLHAQSHGESFFAAFLHRFSGQGLYIMDEPEAALSPLRQMALLTRIHDLVKAESQFIISTHSPIVMAYPDALIYKLTDDGLERCSLEDTDHFLIMKEFVNHREGMLRELLRD
ncbi:AAA family ATPase [Paenibacillus sp. F411]|uniref:AAA family ATPase n=1 Tax=unclassified Paenibacillus TaxID=185978 RepID=UPI001AAE4892|nr:AAA family ATPase [Paenibacillus sp. F411]MBO2945914.1 AAA family ATPase [Paenibacillus sp. F411]